jgi:peptidoglycan/xylan/chitin deacetylase (PgdA/CDA1 family)
MVNIEKKLDDNYGRHVLLVTLLLFSLLMSIFYKLQHNTTKLTIKPIKQNIIIPFMTSAKKGEKVYVLKSKSSVNIYHKNSNGDYLLKLDRFKSLIDSIGYDAEYISEDKISSLSSKDILVISDAIALGDVTKESIKSFLNNGGNLFFNSTTGFSDATGNLIGSNFVSEITGLKMSESKNYLYFKEGLNLTQRLTSPIENKNSGVLLNATVYDNIPIFTTPQDKKADIFMTNYEQTNPPISKNKEDSLTLDEAGCAWHGYYGKGKWFYTNLPSYTFYESKQDEYKDILSGVFNFLSSDIVVVKYPFIDSEKVVFVSEDTEYKFENFKKFSDLSKKYKIPVTAFIVSSIAEKQIHKQMMQNIAKNEYIEFASHSDSHKKIIETNSTFVKQETADTKVKLEQFSQQPIIGFRPPREELDDMMKDYLAKSGFSYVLGASKEYLYPRYAEDQKDLLLIPRHGTDDYSYLINLDWDSEQIVDQIIKETNFVTSLDAIFTLSIHTHLFAFKSNIKIVREYFRYLENHPEFKAMNGRTIAKKVKQSKNIDIRYTKNSDLIVVDIVNNNNKGVRNLTCKIFKNPNQKIKSIKSNDIYIQKDKTDSSEIKIDIDFLKPNSLTTIFIKLG